jgi:hypothetical protein
VLAEWKNSDTQNYTLNLDLSEEEKEEVKDLDNR